MSFCFLVLELAIHVSNEKQKQIIPSEFQQNFENLPHIAEYILNETSDITINFLLDEMTEGRMYLIIRGIIILRESPLKWNPSAAP